jgi:hypothetical protein
MNRHRLSGKSLAVLALLVLVLTALPIAAAQKPTGADKIERALLDRFAAVGSADFIVRFADQADLGPAYTMDWQARGDFVYSTLLRTAARSQAHAQAYLDGRGLAYHTFIAGNELYVWAGSLQTAMDLAQFPEVTSIRATRTYYVDPIVETGPVTEPAPDTYDWGILDTKADQFWSTFGARGDGIVVANIDTGVQWNHPALADSYKCPADPTNPACWLDPSNVCNGSVCDNEGHGTHTMGTMVGDDDPTLQYQVGMAPNARFIMCKGCESNTCSDFALGACADWLLAPGGSAANRPNVVNNSWGGNGCETWYLAKVQAWRAAGIFPAFSAGNEGSGCSTLGSPGDYQESFGSAAHDSSRNIASFSSRGPSCFGHDPYTKPNISAPGVDICSTVPTNSWSCAYSGTSMASPHSAGAVALLWSCNPSLVGQIDQTFQILQNAADTAPAGNCGAPPDGQGNYTFGYGYLDIYQAGLSWCGQTGILNGHVLDATNGNPLNGAHVVAARQGGGSFSGDTDSSGYYQMNPLAGTYDVTASAFGYFDQTASGVVVNPSVVTTQDFLLTPSPQYVVSGYVTEAGTGSPLYAQVVVQGTPIAPVWTDPGSGFYAVTLPQGTYAFHVTAQAHQPQDRTIVVDQNQTQNFSLQTSPCILLVDDDQDAPDVRVYYTEALNSLGYTYDVWDLAAQGNPSSDDLTGYRAVVWFTGYPWSRTFEPRDELAVAAYLDAGGNLFLSSEDYLWEYGITAFGDTYLGISSFSSDVEETDPVGNAGNPVGSGLGPYNLTTPTGWSGSLWTDYVDGANAPFRWQASGENNSTNHAGASFKTVFLGWPFEGLASLGDRTAVLGAIVNWFGGCGPSGTLTGQVTHAYYGSPIAGATVTAGAGSSTTNQNGYYTQTLPAGTYDVTAQKAGYTTQVAPGVVINPGTTVVDFQLSSPVAAIDPSSLHAYVTANGQAVLGLNIANPGEMDLSFAIAETAATGQAAGTYPPLVADISDATDADPSTLSAVPATIQGVEGWGNGTAMPGAGRYRAGSASDDCNRVWVLGGGAGGTGSSDVMYYDSTADTWTAGLASIPNAAQNWQAGYVDGKIYLAGGYNGNHNNWLQIYDIAGNSWSQGANMSTARTPMAAAWGGKLYVFGGNPGPTDAVSVYDPATNAWTDGLAVMPTARSYGRAITADDYIYVVGGGIGGGSVTGAFERYDPAGNTWTSGPALGTARADMSLFYMGAYLYAVGGVTDFTLPWTPSDVVERYYLPGFPSGAWETLPAAPEAFGAAAYDCASDKMWSIGGIIGDSNTTTTRWQDEGLPCSGCNAMVDIPWVSEAPTVGTIPAGGNLDVAVTFSAAAPYNVPGDYYANLLIDSNDPVAGEQLIPVNMTVFEPPPAPVCTPFSSAAARPDVPGPFGEDPLRGHFGTTDFQVINLAPDEQPITAHFLDLDGNEVYRFEDTLPGGGSRVYTPGDYLPAGFEGTVVIETPIGAAMGVVHLETPAETGYNTIFPGVPDDNLADAAYTPIDGCTRLYIHNMSPAYATSLILYVYDPEGTQVGTFGQSIPPLGLVVVDPVTALGLPPGFVGSAVAAADQPIEVTVQSNCGGLSSFVAPAYCGTRLYAPQVPGEESLPAATTISILNPTDSWSYGIVSYTYGFTDTLSLPPRGSSVLTYPSSAPGGPVTIWANQPLVAVVQFTSEGPGDEGTFSYRALAAEEATRAAALPVLFNEPGAWKTGDNIWVTNVGQNSADVRIRYVAAPGGGVYWDHGMVPPGHTRQFTMPQDMPSGRAAALVLAGEGQSIIALAGAFDGAPNVADRHIRYTGTDNGFPFGHEPLTSASFTYDTVLRTVYFSGTAEDGDPPFDFAWDLGDGLAGAGNPLAHYYMTNGTFSVVMTASNNLGFAWATAQGSVVVNAPLPASIVYLPLVYRGQ